MGETCPVCQNIVENGATKCKNCEFTDERGINRKFPIPEDTQNWIETKVIPYRIKWEAKTREDELKKQLEKQNKEIEEQNKEIEKLKKAQKKRQEPAPPPPKAEPGKIETLINKRLFWPVFSIVLGGITGGLFFTFFLNSFKLGLVGFSIIAGVIAGGIGGVRSDAVKALLKDMNGGIQKVFKIAGYEFFCIVCGGIFSLIFTYWIFSKIYYGLSADISSAASIAVGVIGGAFIGLIGFLGGLFGGSSSRLLNRF